MQWQYLTGRRGALRRLLPVALAAGGLACVLAWATPAPADPEGDRQGPPQAFLSGGARSLSVLGEIKDVLERIDARLQRMEAKLAETRQATPPPQDGTGGRVENRRGGDG